ncbi:hypothetical protein M3647_01570 [Paenibacillus cellulositrophicus]|uniref:hypothetical protein n=2 Tax=Paenibacillus cellulositrophicus TaxID=562959 RepID=UPI00203C75DE|nr:hypothetical protein [Paenibacillus cellulositrophicus]MCM2996156.1 hypothetical protein [Paenibacillus cellulositrophicus]
MERWEKLIQIVKAESARFDERDDAIIDLAEFNNNEVIEALFNIAKNNQIDIMLQASAGEVLTEIWIRNSNIDFKKLTIFTDSALNEALGLLKTHKIEWYKEFERLKTIDC